MGSFWGKPRSLLFPADAGARLNHDHRPEFWALAFAGELEWLGEEGSGSEISESESEGSREREWCRRSGC
ncbi:hypothetical protein HMP09_1175 [Sphingomonas sp. HMP9]|nr:hypothetical protein HMP09_1175 [Sphingomonas sp. HMP9]